MIRSAFVEQEEPNHTGVDLAKSCPDMLALRTDGEVPTLIRLIESIFQFHRLLTRPDYRRIAIHKFRSDRSIHCRLLLIHFSEAAALTSAPHDINQLPQARLVRMVCGQTSTYSLDSSGVTLWPV